MNLLVSEVYEALLEAGTSEAKAKAAASAIPVAKDLTTREDLRDLRDELVDRIGQVERELGGRIGQVEREMIGRIGRIERGMAVLKFAYGPAILALLVKIAFFS